MSRGQPPDRVPTLTEVVEMPGSVGAPPASAALDTVAVAGPPAAVAVAAAPAPVVPPTPVALDPASATAISRTA